MPGIGYHGLDAAQASEADISPSRSANSAAAPARPKIGDVWNWCAPNVCPRRAQGVTDAGARFSNHSWDTISNMTPLQASFLFMLSSKIPD